MVEPSDSFDNFLAFHGLQLYAIQFPPSLHQKLYDKLKQEVFDIGFKVKLIVNQQDEHVDLVCSVSNGLKANEDVYLVDHAWTWKYREAEKTLRNNANLLERMLNIVRYADKQDLPSNHPYKKERPSLEQYLQQ